MKTRTIPALQTSIYDLVGRFAHLPFSLCHRSETSFYLQRLVAQRIFTQMSRHNRNALQRRVIAGVPKNSLVLNFKNVAVPLRTMIAFAEASQYQLPLIHRLNEVWFPQDMLPRVHFTHGLGKRNNSQLLPLLVR